MNTNEQETPENDEELIIDMDQEFADGQQVELDFEDDDEDEGGFVFEFAPDEE